MSLRKSVPYLELSALHIMSCVVRGSATGEGVGALVGTGDVMSATGSIVGNTIGDTAGVFSCSILFPQAQRAAVAENKVDINIAVKKNLFVNDFIENFLFSEFIYGFSWLIVSDKSSICYGSEYIFML